MIRTRMRITGGQGCSLGEHHTADGQKNKAPTNAEKVVFDKFDLRQFPFIKIWTTWSQKKSSFKLTIIIHKNNQLWGHEFFLISCWVSELRRSQLFSKRQDINQCRFLFHGFLAEHRSAFIHIAMIRTRMRITGGQGCSLGEHHTADGQKNKAPTNAEKVVFDKFDLRQFPFIKIWTTWSQKKSSFKLTIIIHKNNQLWGHEFFLISCWVSELRRSQLGFLRASWTNSCGGVKYRL